MGRYYSDIFAVSVAMGQGKLENPSRWRVWCWEYHEGFSIVKNKEINHKQLESNHQRTMKE
jgi:hypothetical protein